jgi:hypothetical protein
VTIYVKWLDQGSKIVDWILVFLQSRNGALGGEMGREEEDVVGLGQV